MFPPPRRKSVDLILLIVCINFLPQVIGAVTSEQVSRVLNDLMKKPYDKRVRPLYNEGPLFVRIGVFLESVSNINEQASEVTVTLTLRQTWLEPRLTFNRGLIPNDTLLIIPEQVRLLWIPNTIIVNERQPAIIHDGHEYTRLISEGQVSTSVRMTTTTECILQYSYFPFDTQICDINFSSYTKEIIYEWDDEYSGMKKHIQSMNLQLQSYNAQHFVRDEGFQNSSPIFTLIFVRKWYSYYLTFYSPMITFTFVSLLSLWLFNPKISAIINFLNLSLMNIFMITGDTLSRRPQTDESTSLDQYASLCYSFLFLCIIVNIVDFYFERQDAQPSEESEKEIEELENEIDDIESQHSHSQSPHPDSDKKNKENLKSASKLKPILDKLKKAGKMVCYHTYWILMAGFLLCNIFYWGSNFSGQKSRIKAIK